MNESNNSFELITDRTRTRHRLRVQSIDKIVGNRIALQRCRKGLSREKLSTKVDLSPQMIARYESGHTSMSVSGVFVIGHALDINPCDTIPTLEEIKAYNAVDIMPRVSLKVRRQTQKWLNLLEQLPESQIPILLNVVEELVDGFRIKERAAAAQAQADQLAS